MAATEYPNPSPIGATDPAWEAANVTPNDNADLTYITRGVLVAVAGDVRVTMAGGSTLTIPSLAAGIIHPICVSRIFQTSTTATGIVAFF